MVLIIELLLEKISYTPTDIFSTYSHEKFTEKYYSHEKLIFGSLSSDLFE